MFETPEPPQLSRYIRSIDKFQSLDSKSMDCLARNYIWFADIISLNDPFEGIISYRQKLSFDEIASAECIQYELNKDTTYIKELIEKYNSDREKFLRDYRRKHIDAYEELLNKGRAHGFFCGLSRFKELKDIEPGDQAEAIRRGLYLPSPSLNQQKKIDQAEISMWSHYGAGFKGFLTSFRPESLLSIPDTYANFIKYQDMPELVDATADYQKRLRNYEMRGHFHILESVTTKATLWAHEKEIRIRCEKPQGKYYPQNSITSITFGAKMLDQERESIVRAVIAHNPEAKFYEAQISKNEFKIIYRKLW